MAHASEPSAFDPFVRGPYPVGVRTSWLLDDTRDNRRLTYEVWYPAASRFFGLDLSPSTQDRFTVLQDAPTLRQAAVRDVPEEAGSFPLILYSHASLGHRRESSFLMTHLASYGYVVAAADHTGNTFADLVGRARGGKTRTDAERAAYIQRIISDRVPDLRCLADSLLPQSTQPIGVIGWSFGGWAALAAPEQDSRVAAVVALAPGGSSNPLPGIIPSRLTFRWSRLAPTAFLAAESDRFIPLSGVRELYERTPAEKYLFVLRHADHDHFADHIEVPLCPREHAHLFTRGLALAHLESTMKSNTAAKHFIQHQAVAALQARGVNAV